MTPARVSTLVAAVATRSDSNSESLRIAGSGAANDRTIEIGRPLELPGV